MPPNRTRGNRVPLKTCQNAGRLLILPSFGKNRCSDLPLEPGPGVAYARHPMAVAEVSLLK